MDKNPFINALGAAVYIVAIVIVIDTITSITTIQKTIYIPIFMLSLFVLSAAVMGFLFIYEPACLYLENRKEEATKFFLKTIGFFAGFAALFLAVLLYMSTF